MPTQQRPPGPLTLLAEGDVELRGRLPWSSNATFLVRLCLAGTASDAVYKPHQGERPLWDFPDGLYQREVAAYLVSEALGWGIVPETVARDEAPLGPGSLQRFVDADFSEHYFTLLERDEHHEALRRIAVFDVLVNNTDRKSGHCLLGHDGRIWAIDHGLCFHRQPKLRTVIWDFAGDDIPAPLVHDLARLAMSPPDLTAVLAPGEIAALVARAAALVRRPRLPHPGAGHPYPWPLV